jgi:hypothetical protein
VTTGGTIRACLSVSGGIVLLAGCSAGPASSGGATSAGSAAAAKPSTSFVPAPAPTRTVVMAEPTGPTEAEAERATEVVSRFYSTYLARPGQQTAANFVEPALLRTLYLPRVTKDGVICADALPDTATVAPGKVDGSTATVQVQTTHQGTIHRPIVVTVRLSDLRITEISCES